MNMILLLFILVMSILSTYGSCYSSKNHVFCNFGNYKHVHVIQI